MPTSYQSIPHVPALTQQVLAYLKPTKEGKYLDATLGSGGHAEAILDASQPSGILIGLDIDPQAIEIAQERLQRFSQRVTFFNASYIDIAECLQKVGFSCVNGILFDLGLSSMQVDHAERGFSLYKEGPLDMRFNPQKNLSANDLVNQWGEDQISTILWKYGEEPKARAIAKAICASRPIHTTTQLAQVIQTVYKGKKFKIHPATRSFQAIRIAVNDELASLEKGVSEAIHFLCVGGRIAVISFHSLEDRIIKDIFQRESKDCLCPPEQTICTCHHKASLSILTKKPITAASDEIKANPRARSAKLRVAQKIG